MFTYIVGFSLLTAVLAIRIRHSSIKVWSLCCNNLKVAESINTCYMLYVMRMSHMLVYNYPSYNCVVNRRSKESSKHLREEHQLNNTEILVFIFGKLRRMSI